MCDIAICQYCYSTSMNFFFRYCQRYNRFFYSRQFHEFFPPTCYTIMIELHFINKYTDICTQRIQYFCIFSPSWLPDAKIKFSKQNSIGVQCSNTISQFIGSAKVGINNPSENWFLLLSVATLALLIKPTECMLKHYVKKNQWLAILWFFCCSTIFYPLVQITEGVCRFFAFSFHIHILYLVYNIPTYYFQYYIV